eukprot:scaffold8888_cov161-Amphora_coffeaeformis.AAC.1
MNPEQINRKSIESLNKKSNQCSYKLYKHQQQMTKLCVGSATKRWAYRRWRCKDPTVERASSKKGEIDTSSNIKEEDSRSDQPLTSEQCGEPLETPVGHISSLQGAKEVKGPLWQYGETVYRVQGVGPKTISVSTTARRLAVYNKQYISPTGFEFSPLQQGCGYKRQTVGLP